MLEFNVEQQKVIHLQSGFHACLAPAGSGKTEILTERIIQALQRGIAPQKMLCLTFTNRAGINMREKVNQRLSQQTSGLFIGNIHAFCAKFSHVNQVYPQQELLMEETLSDRLIAQAFESVFELLNYGPQYIAEQLTQIYQYYDLPTGKINGLTADQLHVIRFRIQPKTEKNQYEVWNLKGLRLLILPLLTSVKQQLNTEQMGYLRERIRTFDENIPNDYLNFAFAFAVYLHHHYELLKKNYQLYDYDDLILTSLQFLQKHPQAKMSGYEWVQIDEVQDLSPLHWLLLDHICTSDAHILILGDIYQSIYRFLGASLELTLSKLGENVHYLTQNYRSPANLVEVFNQYSAYHFGQKDHQSVTLNPKQDRALLHLHRRYDTEQYIDISNYIAKEMPKEHSTAILFARNADVLNFSGALNGKSIKHFVISQHDILTTEPALDFLAFLTVLHQPDHRLAWARLLWRFGDLTTHRPKHLLTHDPQFAAIRYLAQLQRQGSLLTDFIAVKHPYQHHLKALVQAVYDDKVVFFDTETTGLNAKQDDIVQIAAMCGEATIDLYCKTDKSLVLSSQIHHISEEKLAQDGEAIDVQLKHFVDFAQEKTIVAHNLAFDDRMLQAHLAKHLPEYVKQYQQQTKYCTLQLTKRFVPYLESYKLADLLQAFKLEGENTHNALDDVFAGQQLLYFLVEKIEQNLTELDGLIDLGESCLDEFNQKFTPLWQQAQHALQQDKFQIAELFKIFFNYLDDGDFKFYQQDYQHKMEQLQDKLLNHAYIHFSHITDKEEYLNHVIEFYQTAKESDLLTEKDVVVVSTIHRSKGLEFENVVLPSVTDDVFPSYFATKKIDLEDPYHQREGQQLLQEQKRLLYVALTRAKKTLMIGSYDLRAEQTTWKYPKSYQLSRFMGCIISHFERI